MSSLDELLHQMEQKLDAKQQQLAREKNFSELANQTFNNNLAAFKHYFPEIHDKYATYNPRQDFQLLVNENGMPNIVDFDTNVPLYADDPEAQVQEQVDAAFKNPIIPAVNYRHLEFVDNKSDNFLHTDLMVEAGIKYNKISELLIKKPKSEGRIPGLVIFGVGLGYHILPLTDRINAAYISIFEPNEDYFFASLFTFDWAGYLQLIDQNESCLFLSIGSSSENAYQAFYDRVQSMGAFSVSNAFFFQHYPSAGMTQAISKIVQNYHEFFMGWGFFDDALMGTAHTINNVRNNLPVLDVPKGLSNKYQDFPIFIVANGPSLDNDIEVLKQLQDKVVVVACNSASTALIKNGIVPDFHVALERSMETYDFLKAYISEDNRKNINLLTVNAMHPDVASLFKWTGMGLKGREAGTSLFQVAEYMSKIGASGTLPYSNPLVGNLALSFVINFGFKNVYLFGMDNGYRDHSNHHSKDSMYYDEQGNEKYVPIKLGEEVQLEGNFGDSFLSDQFLNQGRVQLERLLSSEYNKNVECFNCSDGAKIDGTYPLRSNQILLPDSLENKAVIIEYIKSEHFKTMPAHFDINTFLYVEEFTKICQYMREFLLEPVSNREQAFEQILKQVRFLNSMKSTQYSHLFFLLEGEALYFNSILANVLFSYGEDDVEVLPHYYELRDLWCDFLAIAPEHYQQHYLKNDMHRFQFN